MYLDLIGRTPTLGEATKFLADKTETKRSDVIDKLLSTDQFAYLWTRKWAEVLFGNYYNVQSRFAGKRLDGKQIRKSMGEFYAWLKERIANETPWQAIVADLIMTMGKLSENPSAVYKASFYYDGPHHLNMADRMSKSLLGMQISCARCHDHPFDRWTQEDYYGLAAFVYRVKGRPIGGAKNDECDDVEFYEDDKGDLAIPDTGKVMQPKFLFGGKAGSSDPRLRLLAQFMVMKRNTQLGRNVVNRTWSWLMGRGFVMPVDNFNQRNRPVSASTMELITGEFVRNGASLKFLIRAICNSKAYQRASAGGGEGHFTSMAVQQMSPEQLYRSIVIATTATDEAPNFYSKGWRGAWNGFRGEIGQCYPAGFQWVEVSPLPGNTMQALYMRNSKFVNDRIKDRNGLSGKIKDMDDPNKKLDTIFLSVLTRLPTDAERTEYLQYAEDQNSRSAWEDIIWTLLNSGEFATKH